MYCQNYVWQQNCSTDGLETTSKTILLICNINPILAYCAKLHFLLCKNTIRQLWVLEHNSIIFYQLSVESWFYKNSVQLNENVDQITKMSHWKTQTTISELLTGQKPWCPLSPFDQSCIFLSSFLVTLSVSLSLPSTVLPSMGMFPVDNRGNTMKCVAYAASTQKNFFFF